MVLWEPWIFMFNFIEVIEIKISWSGPKCKNGQNDPMTHWQTVSSSGPTSRRKQINKCINTKDGTILNDGYFLLSVSLSVLFYGRDEPEQEWTGRGAASYMIPAPLPHLVSSPNQSQTPFITPAARRLSSITQRTKGGDKDAQMQTQMLGCTHEYS